MPRLLPAFACPSKPKQPCPGHHSFLDIEVDLSGYQLWIHGMRFCDAWPWHHVWVWSGRDTMGYWKYQAAKWEQSLAEITREPQMGQKPKIHTGWVQGRLLLASHRCNWTLHGGFVFLFVLFLNQNGFLPQLSLHRKFLNNILLFNFLI